MASAEAGPHNAQGIAQLHAGRLSPVHQHQGAEPTVGLLPAADRCLVAEKSHLEVASCLLQLLLQAYHIDLVQSLVVLTSWGAPATLQHGAGACGSGPSAA